MDFTKIIDLVESKMSQLTNACYEQQMQSEFMKNYRKLDKAKLLERHEALYKNMIEWLKGETSKEFAEKYFKSVGATRFNEGFPLAEVNFALFTTKKVFWNMLTEEKKLLQETSCENILESMRIVSNYFDIGSYCIIRGYIHELFSKLDIASKVSREEIEKILEYGALDDEDLNADEFIWRHV